MSIVESIIIFANTLTKKLPILCSFKLLVKNHGPNKGVCDDDEQ